MRALVNGLNYVFHLQELEKSLKATCEEFIMSVTKLIVDPLLSFVAKVCLEIVIQWKNKDKLDIYICKILHLLTCIKYTHSALLKELPSLILVFQQPLKMYTLSLSVGYRCEGCTFFWDPKSKV